MAFQTYQGLSEQEIEEIEEIAGDRRHFLPLKHPNDSAKSLNRY